MSGATSWNSELPSGRNPFWIKDEALAGLGLHTGDAVSVDTAREPADGDLVLVEVETDEISDRLVRRYAAQRGGRARLSAANPAVPELWVEPEQHIVLGVVCTRLVFDRTGDSVRIVEHDLT